MTDMQFNKIMQMIQMILDGCHDLDEAKGKIQALLSDAQKSSAETQNSKDKS